MPLSKQTRNEPIGSNTENYIDVIEMSLFDILSNFPIRIFGFALESSLIEPKKMFPCLVPIAKLIPF